MFYRKTAMTTINRKSAKNEKEWVLTSIVFSMIITNWTDTTLLDVKKRKVALLEGSIIYKKGLMVY